MFGIVVQVAQWLGRNPQAAQVIFASTLATRRAFDNLTPESKAKVEAVIKWGVARAANYALTTVLGEVGSRVVDQVANPQVAEFAKEIVKRGVDIGVEAAMKEARLR
ncbi:hypothetical protein [Fimbriiglobus ruber]|uniref:Uncharacterized protein n=1 Tax=Fimbriiglobus ruber TaxID=1908690 RepID=A0A225DBN0_9BACT|nr:hypothetical protein [Fimbriiglobus ruber]OWK38941.1 hypothetical protein FRUB_06317 [Fimbriiglobus ruber]